MNSLSELMNVCWIRKEDNREKYYKIKYEINDYRKFVSDQLGWRVIHNEHLIRLEKIPAHAESFMGIREFTDTRDYCILCAVLMFLEDMEERKQFLLSELIRYIEAVLKEVMETDWTVFSQRRSLVRSLQFAEKTGMIRVYEGNTDSFSKDRDSEVLYENTGCSRYFAVQYPIDVTRLSSWHDFEEKMVDELDGDRGRIRTNRVYRNLCLCPIMMWEEGSDSDAMYLKTQRRAVTAALKKNMDAHLMLTKNSAYMYYDEESGVTDVHPRHSMISDIVSLVSARIAENASDGRKMKIENNDCIILKRTRFDSIVMDIRERCSVFWGKEYREMSPEKYLEAVHAYMRNWMMIRYEDDNVIVTPACVAVIGKYPKKLEERADV